MKKLSFNASCQENCWTLALNSWQSACTGSGYMASSVWFTATYFRINAVAFPTSNARLDRPSESAAINAVWFDDNNCSSWTWSTDNCVGSSERCRRYLFTFRLLIVCVGYLLLASLLITASLLPDQLSLLLKALAPVSQMRVKSQWLYLVKFEIRPKQIISESGPWYALSQEMLPHVITPLEKKLGKVSNLGKGRVWKQSADCSFFPSHKSSICETDMKTLVNVSERCSDGKPSWRSKPFFMFCSRHERVH